MPTCTFHDCQSFLHHLAPGMPTCTFHDRQSFLHHLAPGMPTCTFHDCQSSLHHLAPGMPTCTFQDCQSFLHHLAPGMPTCTFHDRQSFLHHLAPGMHHRPRGHGSIPVHSGPPSRTDIGQPSLTPHQLLMWPSKQNYKCKYKKACNAFSVYLDN